MARNLLTRPPRSRMNARTSKKAKVASKIPKLAKPKKTKVPRAPKMAKLKHTKFRAAHANAKAKLAGELTSIRKALTG